MLNRTSNLAFPVGELMSRYTRKLFLLLGAANAAFAGTIVFSGQITQPVDQTNPAANNTSLNSIADGDSYLVTLGFLGQITGPGLYNTPDLTLQFVDPAAAATETAFNSVSLSITADGSLLDFSLLGCLSTGDGCNAGNELDANFAIASADLGSSNAAAQLIPGLSPALDLLEDDGLTDVQGTVNTFSSVPEPATGGLLAVGAGALLLRLKKRSQMV